MIAVGGSGCLAMTSSRNDADSRPATHAPAHAPTHTPASPRVPAEAYAGARPDGLTVEAFQELIRERYYATDSARGAAGTFLLFMEEVGELATALHDNRAGKSKPVSDAQRANLVEEFADVLAWLATLANITGVDLTHALAKYTEEGRVKGTKD